MLSIHWSRTWRKGICVTLAMSFLIRATSGTMEPFLRFVSHHNSSFRRLEDVFDAWVSSERETGFIRAQLTHHINAQMDDLMFCRRGRIRVTGTETRAAAVITIPSTSVTSGIRYRAAAETAQITSVLWDISHMLYCLSYTVCIYCPLSLFTQNWLQEAQTLALHNRFLDHFNITFLWISTEFEINIYI